MNSLFGASTSFVFRRICLNKKLYSGIRTLYNAQYLGMDLFVDARDSKMKQFGAMKENFMTRMKQQLNGSSTTMIFTEDLKAVAHLAENEVDLDVCVQMIKRFHEQNKELRFGTFVFGPVVMRLLYHLQRPDLALQLIKDEELGAFFDQLKSYLILMDLLYEKGQYQDVLDLNDRLESKQLFDTKFPRDTVVLALAACYKLNTPESFEYAVNTITKARGAGCNIVRRALHFVIALSLNQNKPDVAMELLSNLTSSNYITNHNLKLLTFAKLGRLSDALSILQNKVERDSPSQTFVRGEICQSVLDVLKEAIDNANDTEMAQTFDQLYQSLKEMSALTSLTVDDLLSVPIAPRQFSEDSDRFAPMRGERRPFAYNERRDFMGSRGEPFFRRRGNIPNRQEAFATVTSD